MRLPLFIQSDSIRIEAEGGSSSQHLTVFDVTSVAPSHVLATPSEDGSKLADLEDAKKSLKSQIAILEKQQAVLQKYSGDIQPVGSGGAIFGPNDLEKFLDVYTSRQSLIDEQLSTIRKELEQTDQEVNELKKRTHVANAGKRLPSVNIIMLAKEAGLATLILSYGVLDSDASRALSACISDGAI